MAVKPTPNNSLYKGFTFDGIDSRDYGVYISGDAVFDSPERDVEMIEIPGRNGSFALDKGRFGNITVSYPAGLFGEDEASFREGIRALRNALASRKGYCRLEDDYNPNEYRMAVYKKGLEVDPALLKAGEFTIEFDCMPQRWLKSGETAVSVASGGTITNPTLFEASPLLQVWGYGDIDINGEDIVISDEVIGDVVIAQNGRIFRTLSAEKIQDFDTTHFRQGDAISLEYIGVEMDFRPQSGLTVSNIQVARQTGMSPTVTGLWKQNGGGVSVMFSLSDFAIGTSGSVSSRWGCTIQYSDNTSKIIIIDTFVQYNGAGRFVIHTDANQTTSASNYIRETDLSWSDIIGHSTKSALGEPLYFDLDIGEAYKIENDEAVSVNNAVTIPAKLPVLVSGVNTITYDSDIEQLKVTPRWWEV